jgi:hypothetical protein
MACRLSIDVSDESDNPILRIEGKPTAKIMLNLDKMVAGLFLQQKIQISNSGQCLLFLYKFENSPLFEAFRATNINVNILLLLWHVA